jgi:hypothetical protein
MDYSVVGTNVLQVNVRRRETEWQEENRLHSHAYLKQIDDAEVSKKYITVHLHVT